MRFDAVHEEEPRDRKPDLQLDFLFRKRRSCPVDCRKSNIITGAIASRQEELASKRANHVGFDLIQSESIRGRTRTVERHRCRSKRSPTDPQSFSNLLRG